MRLCRSFMISIAILGLALTASAQCNWNPGATVTLPLNCSASMGGVVFPNATFSIRRPTAADVYDIVSQCTVPGCTSRIAAVGPFDPQTPQQQVELDAHPEGALLLSGQTTAARLTISASPTMIMGGNVGIGFPYYSDAEHHILSVPTATLDVNGDLKVSGSITGGTVIGAVYQDVAEWVPSRQRLQPGTVVVINRGERNEVAPSTRPYDTGVAGVVSAQPGVILGLAGDTKSQIATTGRVRVHVDATGHPIAAGDLLVTSRKPGVAMVSQPVDLGGVTIHRPGTIIGKALEPLPSGEGDILVLLSLQ